MHESMINVRDVMHMWRHIKRTFEWNETVSVTVIKTGCTTPINIYVFLSNVYIYFIL